MERQTIGLLQGHSSNFRILSIFIGAIANSFLMEMNMVGFLWNWECSLWLLLCSFIMWITVLLFILGIMKLEGLHLSNVCNCALLRISEYDCCIKHFLQSNAKNKHSYMILLSSILMIFFPLSRLLLHCIRCTLHFCFSNPVFRCWLLYMLSWWQEMRI